MLSKYFVPYSTTWLLDSPYLTEIVNYFSELISMCFFLLQMHAA